MRIIDKIDIKTFIFTANIIFIVLYIILSINNRIAHDDYYSIYTVNKIGVIDSVIYQYNDWCTRYISVFVSFSVAGLLQYKYTLFIYNILLLTLFITAIYYSIYAHRKLLNKSTPNDKLQILNYATFIVSAIFYTSFNIGETWFWLSSNSTYLLSVIMLFFAFAFIFNDKKNVSNKIIITLASLFIGGSNGALSVILLFVIFVVFFFYKYKKPNKIIANKLLLSFVSLLISFTLLYLGNGNNVRGAFFNQISVFESFILNIKMTAIILLFRVPNILIYVLLFTIPSYYVFTNTKSISRSTFIKRSLVSTGVLLLLLFFFQLPITYKTQDVAAIRTLFPISILFFVYGLYLAYNIRQVELFRLRIPLSFIKLVLVFIILFNIWNLATQYKITQNYADKYDKRIEYINQMSSMDTVILEPLPNSGFLYSSEISFNSEHYTNQHLKKGLQTKSELMLRKTKCITP